MLHIPWLHLPLPHCVASATQKSTGQDIVVQDRRLYRSRSRFRTVTAHGNYLRVTFSRTRTPIAGLSFLIIIISFETE